MIPVSRGVHMLTHEQIVLAVAKAATKFPLTKVSYFGSYADGNATEESDLDLLVEFGDDGTLTLLDIIRLKHNLEDDLSIPVDVVEIPLTEKAQKRLIIRNTVPVYERA
jgi:predicted nucleotidyltransferase